MKNFFKVWKHLTLVAMQVSFATRFGAFFWIFVKIIRFVLFFLLLTLIFSRTNTITGYTYWQVILFFVTFNIVDVFVKLFLREVYRFRGYVVSGHLDTMLLRPFPILFRVLFGGIDILDLPLLLISIGMLFVVVPHLGNITLVNSLIYVVLICNAFIIATAFHIFVVASAITSTAVDNTIMIYRDVTAMGRLPIDIYREPIRSIITFVIPVGVMISFPSKALFGTLSLQFIMVSFFVSFILLFISVLVWNFSLRHYTSASS